MPQEKRKTTIDAYTYEVQQLGAIEGKLLYLEVVKVVGPTLGAAVKGKTIADLRGFDVRAIQIDTMIDTFVAQVSPTVFTWACELLAKTTEVWGPSYGKEGAPLDRNFDQHFAGKYAALTQWLVFAVKVNLADFFDSKASGLGALVNLAAGAEASKSQAA